MNQTPAYTNAIMINSGYAPRGLLEHLTMGGGVSRPLHLIKKGFQGAIFPLTYNKLHYKREPYQHSG